MADYIGLRGEPVDEPDAHGGEAGREDRSPAGPALFWVVGALLVLGAVPLSGGARLPRAVETALLAVESGATALALVVGALALVRYYSRRRRTYLIVGTGFLAMVLPGHGEAVRRLYRS